MVNFLKYKKYLYFEIRDQNYGFFKIEKSNVYILK